MVLLPPDGAAAAPPAVARQRGPAPEPLDPELEAQLRRQRAQQYGRVVRESLAAEHARAAARREAAAAAQREQWEAQRVARLARLAERQAQHAQALAQGRQQSPRQQRQKAPGKLAVSNAAPGELLHAVREHAPPSEQQENAGDKARCSGAARHPEAACSGAEHGGACSPSAAPASHVAWCSVVPPGVATAPPPSAPADPLEQLLGELLAAEAGGDPFSIINLFVAEQLEVQRQQAARQAQQQLQRQQQRARQAADAAMQDAMCKQESAAQACTAPRASGDKLADSTELRHAHAAAAALARQPAAPQAAGAQPSAPAAGPQRPPRGASDGENVSANVRHRHRRSSSMVLPAEFDPSELSAAGPSGLFAGPSGLLGGPSGLLPGGGSVPAPAPAPLMRASSEPASFMERHAQAPALPPAPLQAQESSSKQLYVQQWLQRSTAELEQASTVAGSPRSAAAPAESEVEQQAGGLSSPASSLAQTVQPMQRGVVHPAAAVDTAEEEQEEEAAGQAQRDADGGAAVGMSALSEMSASSGDGSHAPPPPRPSAPVPPSGSSLMDGSSALSASLDLARMPAAQQAAAQQPQQRPVAASPRLLQNPFGGDVRAAGRQWRHGGSSSGSSSYAASSSVDGSEGEAPMAAAEGPAEEEAASAGQPAEAHADASEHSEPQAALSFGQLQAVSGVAGGANRLPDDAAAEADDWRPREPSSSTDGSEAEAAPVVAAAAAAAAAAGAAAAAAARAQPPATITAQQSASELADSEGRSSLGSEVEISYGEQYSRAAVRQAVAVADNSADVAAQATSPRLVPQPQQASALPAQSPRQQQQQQVLPRPRSPLHAADDRYPSSPPASPGGLQRTVSAGSRPASPAGAFLYSPASSRRASLAEEASAASRPASPPVAALHRSSEQREAHPEGSFVTVVERSLSAGSNSSSGGGGGAEGLLRDGGAASPYAMLRFGTDAEAEGCSDAAAAAAAAAAAEALLSPRSPAATMAAASSPPGTPLVVSPGDDDASTCPGSAHVEDDTVVQSEEHVRAYLGEVMAYFWQERAEGFAAGQVPPLDLEGYLAIERRRPPCGDPQHIFNKLLFDAANEALAAHYVQALDSYTGRMAPRLALLSAERLEQGVVQRVLRWAAAGGAGDADPGTLLAEDAAEEERALGQLAAALQAELAAAAEAQAASRSASPTADQVGEGAA